MKRARLLLADDHALFAEGARLILEPEFECVDVVEDGRRLLDAVAEQRPDAVLIDVAMPSLNGIEAVRKLRKDGYRTKLIMLTMHADGDFVSEAFEAGANAYVLKHCGADELRRAVRETLSGKTYVCPRVADILEKNRHGRAGRPEEASNQLTPRQREVLQLMAEGRIAKEIATALKISPRTVEFHRYNIMNKLGLHSSAELARYAVRRGLVES